MILRRIARTDDGTFMIALYDEEREVLAALADQVRSKMLDADDADTTRLFPPAYAERPELEAEYRELMGDDLLRQRLEALDAIEATGTEELDEDGLVTWMQAANTIRLVIGTRLDVSEEGDDYEPDDPAAPLYAAYEFLGHLVAEAVDALSL